MTREDAFEIWLPIIKMGVKSMPECSEALDMAIKALKQTRWIPVSERLPEVGSKVLICYEFKKKRYIYIAVFHDDGLFYTFDYENLTKVIAWMPLPEPYKASPTGAEGSKE